MAEATDFAAFVERFGEQSAEVAWLAALAWLERASQLGHEALSSRFRWFPEGELRSLRHEIHGALMLARFACAMQAEDNEMMEALTRPLREEANKQAAARRREQTKPAERVRLSNAKAKRRRAASGNGDGPT